MYPFRPCFPCVLKMCTMCSIVVFSFKLLKQLFLCFKEKLMCVQAYAISDSLFIKLHVLAKLLVAAEI